MQNVTRRGATNVALSPDDYRPEDLLWLSRLGRELRLTDQILSVDLDTVSIVESGPAPAWTTLEGDHITFSMRHMPLPKTHVDVAVWLGTNAHELGHVLYSPRRHSPLMHRIIEGDELFLRGIAQLHNIVEDQRQERLILAKFSPWRNYLIAALSHHLVVKSSGAWLLLTGRTWISDQVRDAARAAFVIERDETTAREVAQLVGDYQRLTDPGESEADEAWDILVRLHTLFDLDVPPGGCGGGVIVNGDPDTDAPTGTMWPTADEAESDDATDGDGDGDGEAGDSDDDADGDGTGQADEASQGETDSATQGTGAGAGDKDAKPPKPDLSKIRDTLRDDANKGLSREPDSKADLDSILDALRNGRGSDGGAEGDMAEGEYRACTDAARRLHHEVGDALLDLKDESEPGWVKGVSNGRLNVRRLLNPNMDPDTMFDRYSPGVMDATELEVCVLLDVSGSMASQCPALSEAAWAIRHAVDDIDGRVSMFTFSSGHRVLAQPGERPDDRMFQLASWGGTDPETSLTEAFRMLADSQARNRLCVILTDGSWSNPHKAESIIAAMRELGIITVLAYMPPKYFPESSSGDDHGVEHYQVIAQPSDFAVMFRNVALARMGQWFR